MTESSPASPSGAPMPVPPVQRESARNGDADTARPPASPGPTPRDPHNRPSPDHRGTGALRWLSIAFRVAVVLVILLVGGGVYWLLSSMRAPPASVVDPEPPLSVVTVRVDPVAVSREWTGFGTVRAMDEADISAQVSARVVERPASVEAGNAVSAGDVLVRLESIDFELRAEASRQAIAAIDAELDAVLVDRERLADQVSLAQEQADIAQREYERFVDAQAGGISNQIELDARLTALRRAQREVATLRQALEQLPSREASLLAQRAGEQTALRIAQENLARATITSPIDGVIQEVFAQPGELLSIGAPVARVVSLGRVEVPVRLPVSALGSVGVGDTVTLTPDGPDERSWSGRVSRISPEADAASRTVAVFVEVAQAGAAPDELLRPGRFVRARVTTSQATERVLVPRRAVLDDAVFVAVDPGDARTTTTGRDTGEYPVVRRVGVRVLFRIAGTFPGLDPSEGQWAVLEGAGDLVGERVITTNLDRLQVGGPVRATDADQIPGRTGDRTGRTRGADVPGDGGAP